MGEWKEAFCWLCGRTMGRRAIKSEDQPGLVLGHESRWADTRGFTADKPFGVIRSSGGGRGGLKTIGYYEVDEDGEGYFADMKARLFAVLEEGVAKGWWTWEEIEALKV